MIKMGENLEIKCCGEPLEFKSDKVLPWQSYNPERANCNSCDTYFEKKKDLNHAYKLIGIGEYS